MNDVPEPFPWTERHQNLADEIEIMCLDMSAMATLLLITSGIDWHEGVPDSDILTAAKLGYPTVAVAMRAGDIARAPNRPFVFLTADTDWETVDA